MNKRTEQTNKFHQNLIEAGKVVHRLVADGENTFLQKRLSDAIDAAGGKDAVIAFLLGRNESDGVIYAVQSL